MFLEVNKVSLQIRRNLSAPFGRNVAERKEKASARQFSDDFIAQINDIAVFNGKTVRAMKVAFHGFGGIEKQVFVGLVVVQQGHAELLEIKHFSVLGLIAKILCQTGRIFFHRQPPSFCR